MDEFSRGVLIQISATICCGDMCALNVDQCFNFTVCYYGREILCGCLALCKWTGCCTCTLIANNWPTV